MPSYTYVCRRGHPIPSWSPICITCTLRWLIPVIAIVAILGITVSVVSSAKTKNCLIPIFCSNPQPIIEVDENDKMPRVLVSAGEFIMGSSQEDLQKIQASCPTCNISQFQDESPQIKILPPAFWIDEFEVTNGRYALCVEKGGCTPPHEDKSRLRRGYYGNSAFADYPVIYVDWFQADAYCRWSGRRLPTELEWEKAARGMDGKIYPWGENIDCSLANYRGKENNDTCNGDTVKVGSYPAGASVYGAQDMAGNVWEWIADINRTSAVVKTPILPTPVPSKIPTISNKPQPTTSPSSSVKPMPTPIPQEYKMIRGGSWGDAKYLLRSTYRNARPPSNYFDAVGFRCAKDAGANK